MPIYESLAIAFPNLKIIMEHITTKEAVDLLDKYENLYATVTLHHLLITLDDVAGGMLKPHLFCKPIAKDQKIERFLLNMALGANPKLMFEVILLHILNIKKSHVVVLLEFLLLLLLYKF